MAGEVGAEHGNPLVVFFAPALKNAVRVFFQLFPSRAIDSEAYEAHRNDAATSGLTHLCLEDGGFHPVRAIMRITNDINLVKEYCPTPLDIGCAFLASWRNLSGPAIDHHVIIRRRMLELDLHVVVLQMDDLAEEPATDAVLSHHNIELTSEHYIVAPYLVTEHNLPHFST